jgi:hypothetical protein
MRAFQKVGEVAEHDAGGGHGFAGVGQQAFGADVGATMNMVLGLRRILAALRAAGGSVSNSGRFGVALHMRMLLGPWGAANNTCS